MTSQHEQEEADRVETKWLPLQLLAFFHEIVRVAENGVTSGERHEPERHIDQKYPAPVILVSQVTAQGRTDDWRQQGG
jgi:hypothetical protein